ncbi:MAG TPA: TerB family tellurite resistance protein [Polyangiaceae bacterium]|jgi:tellurite resistance protein|nr:TerB family tellurite resistance protein [Polyangiaceae bacterium]
MRNTDPAFVRDLSDEKVEALVEIMYLAAAADGELAPAERARFNESAERLTSRVIVGPELDKLLARAKADLDQAGRAARLAAVKARLPDIDARKLALALAIQITAADGIIRTSERELILETAAALDIDGDTAANMVRDLSKT